MSGWNPDKKDKMQLTTLQYLHVKHMDQWIHSMCTKSNFKEIKTQQEIHKNVRSKKLIKAESS